MKKNDSILSNYYHQKLTKQKTAERSLLPNLELGGDNGYAFRKRIFESSEPEQRVDPKLRFFNGGFLMPAEQGGESFAGIYGKRNYKKDVLTNFEPGGFKTTFTTTIKPQTASSILMEMRKREEEKRKKFPESRIVAESTRPNIQKPVVLTNTQIQNSAGLNKKQTKSKNKRVSFKDNTYTNVDASGANTFRNLMPVPANVSQMLAKQVFGDARMNNESLTDEQKLILWNVIQNSKKRTGLDNSGTEYTDYGGLGYGSADDFTNWFNKGKIGKGELVWKSLSNPGFTLASTIGRGRYWTDPQTGDVYYTDVYDWNTGEKNFKGDNLYQNLRNKVRSTEVANPEGDPTKNDMFRMNFVLSKKEIEKLQEQQNNPQASNIFDFFKEKGGQKQKFAPGGYTGFQTTQTTTISPSQYYVPTESQLQQGNYEKMGDDFVKNEEDVVVTGPKRQDRNWLSYVNPFNWGVDDYSKYTFEGAYERAKRAGEKEFMWGNKRYTTGWGGTDAQEMQQYGITSDQRVYNPNETRLNLGKLNTTAGYAIDPVRVASLALTGKDSKENGKIIFNDYDDRVATAEHDAFRLYLGLPQTRNSFSPSRYKKGAFEINDYKEAFPIIITQEDFDELVKIYGAPEPEDEKGKHVGGEESFIKPFGDLIMGKHTVTKGEDDKGQYFQYNDVWDLDTYKLNANEFAFKHMSPKNYQKIKDFKINNKHVGENILKAMDKNVVVGDIADKFNKPFEIEGRIYYKRIPGTNQLIRSDQYDKYTSAGGRLRTEYAPSDYDLQSDYEITPAQVGQYINEKQNKALVNGEEYANGGDISLPNVYPNQLVPKFVNGGTLKKFFPGGSAGFEMTFTTTLPPDYPSDYKNIKQLQEIVISANDLPYEERKALWIKQHMNKPWPSFYQTPSNLEWNLNNPNDPTSIRPKFTPEGVEIEYVQPTEEELGKYFDEIYMYGGKDESPKYDRKTKEFQCPPDESGRLRINVDGNCVYYDELDVNVFQTNKRGAFTTDSKRMAGNFADKNKLPLVVGPSVVIPQGAEEFYKNSPYYKNVDLEKKRPESDPSRGYGMYSQTNPETGDPTEQELNQTLQYIHKNGLKAAGVGDGWLIKPGQYSDWTDDRLRNAVQGITQRSPGYTPDQDWKAYAPNLRKLYNSGDWTKNFFNTLEFGNNYRNAARASQPKAWYSPVTNFLGDIAMGTAMDFTKGTRYLAGKIGEPNPIYNTYGENINSQEAMMYERNAREQNPGFLGFQNLPVLEQAGRDLVTSGKNFYNDPSLYGAGNIFLNAANVGFQGFLSTPAGGFGSTAGTRQFLRQPGRSIINAGRDILGNYSGKNLLGKGMTFAGTPVRFVHNAYWGPATAMTGFGRSGAPAFRIGDYGWQEATGTAPFEFMWDPISEKFYDPSIHRSPSTKPTTVTPTNTSTISTTGTGANTTSTETKSTPEYKPVVVPKKIEFPTAYAQGRDTSYNLNLNGKIFTIDTRTSDGKLVDDYLKSDFNLNKKNRQLYDFKNNAFVLKTNPEYQSILEQILNSSKKQ